MAASAVHLALTYDPSVNLYIPSTSAALSEYTRGYSQVLERNYVLIGARLSTLSRAIGAQAAYGIDNSHRSLPRHSMRSHPNPVGSKSVPYGTSLSVPTRSCQAARLAHR